MAKLTINTDMPRNVFERAYTGDPIPPEKSKKFCTLIVSSIENANGLIKFPIVVQFPKDVIPENERGELLALAWAAEKLPKELSQSGYWDYFGEKRFEVSHAPGKKVEAETMSFETDLSMSERASATLDESLQHLAKVEEHFDSALAALSKLVSENKPFGFKVSLPEARRHFLVLESVVSCSIGGYGAREVRNALKNYEELGRRKDENNRNYQSALREVQNIVWGGLWFPTVWGRRPEIPRIP